ncbi:MAG: transposase family protein [Sciscionella sp.]
MTVSSALSGAVCPRCGTASVRTHGGYQRTLADMPLAGRRASGVGSGWMWASAGSGVTMPVARRRRSLSRYRG